MSTYPYGAFVSTTPFPISTGEVLDKLWKTLRGNWKLYLWLGSPLAAAGILFMALYAGALFASGIFPVHPGVMPNLRALFWVYGAMIIVSLPNLFVFALYQAATAFATLSKASGQQTTMRGAYAAAWRKAGRNCWLMILQYLWVSGPILLVMVLAAGLMGLLQFAFHPNPAGMFVAIPFFILLYMGAMAYAIWMILRLGLAFPAAMAEDLRAVEALKRSSRLSQGVRGKLFLVLLVVSAISYGAVMVVEFVVFGIVGLGVVLFQLMHLSIAVGIASGVVAGLIFLALMFAYTTLAWAAHSISFTIVYCDQRWRLDGPIGEFSQIQPEAPLA
jgi:membrane-anchored glycerophosphoryl diester phosphodiesterase (GDPDase)